MQTAGAEKYLRFRLGPEPLTFGEGGRRTKPLIFANEIRVPL